MKPRKPQLALRLEATSPDPAARWREGMAVPYLGETLRLRLGTRHKETTAEGGDLHLPLPPEASARQIQDAAEAWLRAQALAVISAQAGMEARQLGRPAPAVALSFATRAAWAQADDRGGLRCHWRLVEQPAVVIAQVVARAVASLPPPTPVIDLFARA